MNDWFEWKGIRSTTYGIHLISSPSVFFPEQRGEFVDVPGRSGSLYIPEGDDVYNDQELSLTCFLDDANDLNTLSKYLAGSGKLTFPSRQGGYYKATCTGTINLDVIVPGYPHRGCSISFRLSPLFYSYTNPIVTVTQSGTEVLNPGNVRSKPKITVICSGAVTISINDQEIGIIVPENSNLTDTSLIIDCESEECLELDEESFANRRVVMSDFPTLLPGNNLISWSGDGTVTRIEIDRRVRSR